MLQLYFYGHKCMLQIYLYGCKWTTINTSVTSRQQPEIYFEPLLGSGSSGAIHYNSRATSLWKTSKQDGNQTHWYLFPLRRTRSQGSIEIPRGEEEILLSTTSSFLRRKAPQQKLGLHLVEVPGLLMALNTNNESYSLIDSSIGLTGIQDPPNRWKTSVDNRVAIIHKQNHQSYCILQKSTTADTLRPTGNHHPDHTRSWPGSDLLCEDGTTNYLMYKKWRNWRNNKGLQPPILKILQPNNFMKATTCFNLHHKWQEYRTYWPLMDVTGDSFHYVDLASEDWEAVVTFMMYHLRRT